MYLLSCERHMVTALFRYNNMLTKLFKFFGQPRAYAQQSLSDRKAILTLYFRPDLRLLPQIESSRCFVVIVMGLFW